MNDFAWPTFTAAASLLGLAIGAFVAIRTRASVLPKGEFRRHFPAYPAMTPTMAEMEFELLVLVRMHHRNAESRQGEMG